MSLKEHFSFDIVKETFPSQFDISPEKVVSKRGGDLSLDFVGWSEKCLTNDRWIFPSVGFVAFFIQTFHRPICTHWSLNMLLTRGEAGEEGGRKFWDTHMWWHEGNYIFFWLLVNKHSVLKISFYLSSLYLTSKELLKTISGHKLLVFKDILGYRTLAPPDISPH